MQVHVGGDRYVHVKSYVNVDKATLVALQAGKTKSDPLDHFWETRAEQFFQKNTKKTIKD